MEAAQTRLETESAPALTRSRVLAAAALIAAVPLLVYGLWVYAFLKTPGHESRDLVIIGLKYLASSDASPLLRVDPNYHRYAEEGYDGQFTYYIAIDPANAHHYMSLDDPAYRYTRILFPIAVRALALGNPEQVPRMMIALNLLAVTLGTFAPALWLRLRRVNPWFSLAYAFYPGMFFVVERDTVDGLAYSLLAVGAVLLELSGAAYLAAAGCAFALAGLTRENSLIFPVFYAGWMLLGGPANQPALVRVRQNWPRAALLGGLAVLPLVAWKLGLWWWLGFLQRKPIQLFFEEIPFRGFLDLAAQTLNVAQVETISSVILPGLICGGAALWGLRRQPRSVALWLLLVNFLLMIVFQTRWSFTDLGGLGRYSLPVVVAAILSLPVLDRLTGGNRTWFWTSSALWAAPAVTSLLIPIGLFLLHQPPIADIR